MGHIWKKWVTLGRKGHPWKNGSHLEKWITLGKMGVLGKEGVELGKMGHT